MNLEDFQAIAWRDFCLWAFDRQDIRGEFERATGKRFMPPPKNGIEAAIDKATGANTAVMKDFIEWVTINYWGLEDAPKAYRESLHPATAQPVNDNESGGKGNQ